MSNVDWIFLECSLYFFQNVQSLYKLDKLNINKYLVPFSPAEAKKKLNVDWIFLECNLYFSRMHLKVLYSVVKFQTSNYNTFRDMNYFPPIIF